MGAEQCNIYVNMNKSVSLTLEIVFTKVHLNVAFKKWIISVILQHTVSAASDTHVAEMHANNKQYSAVNNKSASLAG